MPPKPDPSTDPLSDFAQECWAAVRLAAAQCDRTLPAWSDLTPEYRRHFTADVRFALGTPRREVGLQHGAWVAHISAHQPHRAARAAHMLRPFATLPADHKHILQTLFLFIQNNGPRAVRAVREISL